MHNLHVVMHHKFVANAFNFKIAPMKGLRTLIPLFVFYCSIPQFSKKFTIILPGLLYYSCCHDKYLLQQAVFLPILTL